MNNREKWEDLLDRTMAGGDIFLVEKLLSDPSLENVLEASRLLHGLWAAYREQKYPNEDWRMIGVRVGELMFNYAAITGQRLFASRPEISIPIGGRGCFAANSRYIMKSESSFSFRSIFCV
jgi:hypothetical protein